MENSCNYHTCEAKREIERLIAGHKKISSKQDRIDAHHSELLHLHTKMSGEVTVLHEMLKMHSVDREEKHKSLIEAISNSNKALDTHTKEEMSRFDEIYLSFKDIQKAINSIILSIEVKETEQNEKMNDIKLLNNIAYWKIGALFTILVTVGSYLGNKVLVYLAKILGV